MLPCHGPYRCICKGHNILLLWEFFMFCYLHKAAILNWLQHTGTLLLLQDLDSWSMPLSAAPQLRLHAGGKVVMGDASESKKFGTHSFIQGRISLQQLRSLQLRGQKFILQFSRTVAKLENLSCFTVSPEQPLSRIVSAFEAFTQGERKRWGEKYLNQVKQWNLKYIQTCKLPSQRCDIRNT